MDISRFVEPKDTALLIIDIQNDYLSSRGALTRFYGFKTGHFKNNVLLIKRFADKARSKGLLIIWTRMVEDSNYTPKNLSAKIRSGRLHQSGTVVCSPNTWGFDYFVIRPERGDKQITKMQYDAFHNPKLGALLKKNKIKNIIFAGGFPSRCVDAAVKSAFTKGYNCVIPDDLILSYKEHRIEREGAFSAWKKIIGYVIDSKKIINAWESGGPLTYLPS